jgi:hypothetical protein
MPILADEIARALADLYDALADENGVQPTFTWSGQTLNCTVGKVRKTNLFGSGGLAPDDDLRLDALLSDFSTTPEPGQLLVYGGENWRIDKVEISVGESVVSLYCNDPNRASGFREREM